MNESDTRLKLIDPVIKKKWSLKRMTTEYCFTDGEIIVRGHMVARGNKKKADYLLSYTPDLPIAIVEAKDTEHAVGAGMQQAMGYLFGQDCAKVELKRRLIEDFNLHTVVRMPQSVFAPYTSITTNILFFDNTGKSDGVWFYRMDMPEGYKHFSKTKPMRSEHFDHVRVWWHDRGGIELPDGPKAKHYIVDELAAGGFNFDLCGYPHEEEVILPPDELIRNYRAERAKIDAEIDTKLAQICEILGIEVE